MLDKNFSRILDAYFNVISEASAFKGGDFDDMLVSFGSPIDNSRNIEALEEQIKNSKDPKPEDTLDEFKKNIEDYFKNFKKETKNLNISKFLDKLKEFADVVEKFEKDHNNAFVSKAPETNQTQEAPKTDAPKTGDSNNSKKTNNGKDGKQPQEPNVEVNAEVNKT